MARKATGIGPTIDVHLPAQTPGAPTWVESGQFVIASTNDVLVLTSDQGGPVSIDVDDGVYTGDALATELQTKMNADGTLTGGAITFAVSWDSSTEKFTIDAGEGHEIALTYSGSDGASTFGFTANASAAQTITSDSETHGSGTITFDLDENGNGATVEYAIYCNELTKYVGADGVADEAAEVWQTADDWDNGGQDARVTVTGLTDHTSYTFKVKARNENGDETAFGSSSAAMNTYTTVDWGSTSSADTKRVTGGNTRIKEDGVTLDDGTTETVYANGTSKAIPIQFALENYDETTSRVVMEFSEDSGSTWATAHTFFDIYAGNKTLRFTSDLGGPVDISLDEGTYDTGADVATNLQTKMNANGTLTGGVITFAVTYTDGEYEIDAGEGHTIALDYYNSNGAFALGFTGNKTAARTITSDESRGDPQNTLTTSEAGTSHTIYWDSGRDAGKSELKSTAMIRLTPYDASPSGGDAAKTETSDAFTVNNRPGTVTVQNYDGRTFAKDTTPTFSAVMADLTLGDYGYWEITIEDETSVVLKTTSAENIAGWEYEQSTDDWHAVPVTGVAKDYIDGTNRVRYTCQTALSVDNDNDYTITMRQGERRDRG